MAALWWVLGAGSVGAFLLALALILVLGFRGSKLPPGIVRAVLAVILVGIFVVVIIGGVVLATQDTALSDENRQFYLSVVAPLGTLAAAAAAFYFGTKSAQAPGAATAPQPTGIGVTNAQPRSAEADNAEHEIIFRGWGFDEGTKFVLRHAEEGDEIDAKEKTIHSSQVATAQFELKKEAKTGKYHVVATGSTGEKVSLRDWFTIVG